MGRRDHLSDALVRPADAILRLAGPAVLLAGIALPALEASTLLGSVPGVLALALGGMLAQQDRAAVGLQADRLIGRSSAYRDARSAFLEDAGRRDGSVGWQAGRPCRSLGQRSRLEPGRWQS